MSFIKEIFSLIRRGKWRELFLEPTLNGGIQFFRYAFVGAVATIVDWVLLFLFENLLRTVVAGNALDLVAKYIAAAIGFIGGLLVNYFLTRTFVFNSQASRANSKFGEFMGHCTVGVIGLLLTELILLGGDIISLHYMVSKIIATGIVFFWNYLARKFFVYKK